MAGIRAALIGAVALAGAVSAGQSRQSAGTLAVTGVSVVDPVAGTTAAGMIVVVRDERIASVDKDGVPPPGAVVVDGRGKFLMPGMWDMHVHLSYARPSALPALVANGVTAVRDVGSDLAELDRWRGQIEAGTLVGPSILRSGPMLNGMEFNTFQLAVADGAEARTAVRTLRKVGVDFIKLHRRTSRDAYFAIAEEARAQTLPFIGHVPMTVSPAEASDAGQRSIEHTETLFEGTFAASRGGKDQAHEIAQWRETEAAALFAKFANNGTFVDPTLVAQEQVVRLLETGKPDQNERFIAASARAEGEKTLAAVRPGAEKMLRERKPVLSEIRAVTGLMNRAGVKLLTGTDLSFFHAPGFSLHDELALLVEAGLSTADALRAATDNPSAMFPSFGAGRIAVGMRADLVLLDASPLVDIRNTRRISAVVVRGALLERADLDRLLEKAARLAATN